MLARRAAGLRMLLGGVAALALSAGPSAAVEKRYNIPPQGLKRALQQFGVQSGDPIIYRGAVVGGLRSRGAIGVFEPEEALAALLDGSNLSFLRAQQGFIVIAQEPHPAQPQLSQPPRLAPPPPREVHDLLPNAQLPEIVVTGTSIRGVAPVGSNLVSVGREEFEKAAAIGTGELTNTIPSITQAGSAPVGENTFSYYAPSIHNIGGSASSTTLVIVDGLRMPGGGTQFAQPDPNIIPSSALQRVEVLAEGSSSVYGSDAVAGVINYITRRNFQGVEVAAKAGWADDWASRDVNVIAGTSWASGSMYVAAQYAYQDALANSARGFLSRGDYRPKGQNLQTFNCSPATIRTPASGAYIFLSPAAMAAVSGATSGAPCNNTIFGDVLPNSDRKTALVRVTQEVGDRLTLTGTANYGFLSSHLRSGAGNVNAVTAFGPGSGREGQINPFYKAPAGEPSATQEILNWSARKPDGDYGRTNTGNDTLYLYGAAQYELTDRWAATLSSAFGRSRSNRVEVDRFCAGCAILAINGTTQAGGSTTTSSMAGSRVVVLDLPLTPANALDVWAPDGGGSSAGTLRNLYSVNTELTHWNTFNQTKLDFGGSLFDLPAGPLRVAFGAEYMWMIQDVDAQATGGLGYGLNSSLVYRLQRDVYSGYVEVYVPVVSDDMDIPFVQRFDLNLSGRYDRYSDVGSTANPKVAASWEIIEGLTVRGNYATAFVAPPLNTIGIPSAGYRRLITGASVDASVLNLPVALYPEVTRIPGCTTATVTCQVGGATPIQGLTRTYGVGPDAKNQTGNSWSVGADFAPTWLPNFRASATFWSNRLKEGVDSVGITYQINIPQLHRVTICPTGCSTAQIDAFTNIANGGALSSDLPAKVYFLRNNDLGNVVNLRVQGIDFSVQYAVPTERAGRFTLGASGSYLTRFQQDYLGLTFSLLGTSGSNQTYPSVQARYRLNAGWELGTLSVTTFVNHTSSYRNWSNLSLMPVVTSAQGALIGGGDKVRANTTLDLNVRRRLPPRFGEASVYVDIKNVLDSGPPFYSGNTSGIAVGGNGYNGFVSNPIGRTVSLGLKANF